MAYGLKYYKELTQPNGKVVRLEILEKGYEGASKEIGPVCQALRLDIQGDTEIDAPIVKTSLSMTFVDAPDHVDARTKKCGNWDEFYTSDATLWRVVLKARNAQETAFATMWGGYITPDSYTEVLQYRGSVTLVARDNIGHLSDFPFDAEGNADGMISLIELIREAWDKIESPMTLDDQAVANADWMLSDGVYAYDTYMNVSAFEDMNWYDALESALYAYGLVLRYTGNNNVSFYSLRNLPRMGAHEVEDISFIEPTFMSGAERELTPAVKRIEEAVEYKIESAIQPQVKHEDFTLNRDYYTYDYGSASGKIETGIVEAISNTDKTKGWANEADKTLFFDPNAYELSDYAKVQPYAETLKKSMYIAVNNVKNASLDNIDRFVTYGKTMRCQDFAYVFNLGMLIQWSGSGKISKVEGYSLSGMTYAVSMERLGITYYYAGEGRWQTSYKELNLELAGGDANNSVEIPIGIGQYGSPDPANFVIYIKRISYTRQGDEASGRGLYVAIQSLEIASPQTSPIFAKNNVNTAYDNTNNVILSRDPKIAPALNTVSLPALIQNGIFIKRGEIYDSAKSWAWDGHTPQQMAVYNHLQLLCYHAKPNNILRGTIVNADVADMQVIWMWHGAEHMLVSGTLDLISGYIENAVLREFARYEDMWGMLEPADMPEVEGKSSTNVEGGVAASNEGARMTSTTTVNIGGGGGSIVLDTFMSDTSQNGVQNRVIKAYVDDSCSDLDTRLQAKVDNIANNKADNTTVTALTERVSTNEGAIDALDKRVTAEEAVTTTYASWWADLKQYIKVEGGNIKIDTNLIVTGDTSSEGSGQDTPASGTVTGVTVGSTNYTDVNAGLLNLTTLMGLYTPLSSYNGLASRVATLEGKATAVSFTQTQTSGTKIGSITIDGVAKNIYTPTIPTKVSAFTNDSGYITGITKSMVATALGASTGGRYLIDTGGDVSWANVPTKLSQFTDDVVSGKYLPLSGGTIKDSAGLPLVLNTSSSTSVELRLQIQGSNRVQLGYNTTDGVFIGAPAVGYRLGITTGGTPIFYNGTNRTLIHSGNIGSYNAGSATKLQTARTIWGQSFDGTGNVSGNITLGAASIRGYDNRNILESTANDLMVGYGYATSSLKTTIFGNTIKLNDAVLINPSGNVTIGDSDLAGANYALNVGNLVSIQKMQNPAPHLKIAAVGSNVNYIHMYVDTNNEITGRALVLQNGYGNVGIGCEPQYKLDVNGALGMGGIEILDKKSNALYIGYGSAVKSALPTYLWGKGIHFINSGGQLKMLVSDEGNVGIGAPNPQYKLEVNGTGEVLNISNSSGGAIGIRFSRGTNTSWSIVDEGGNLKFIENASARTLAIFYESSQGANLALAGGLDIAGASKFTGAVTMSSTLSVGGNTTINGNLVVSGDVASA